MAICFLRPLRHLKVGGKVVTLFLNIHGGYSYPLGLDPSDLLLAITQQGSGSKKTGFGTVLEIRTTTRLSLTAAM